MLPGSWQSGPCPHICHHRPSLLTRGQKLRDTEQEVCRGQALLRAGAFVCAHAQPLAALGLFSFNKSNHLGTSTVKSGGPVTSEGS